MPMTVIDDHDYTMISSAEGKKSHQKFIVFIVLESSGKFKHWGQDTTDFVNSMRFTRSGCVSRHVFSDEVGGHNLWYLRRTDSERDTPRYLILQLEKLPAKVSAEEFGVYCFLCK